MRVNGSEVRRLRKLRSLTQDMLAQETTKHGERISVRTIERVERRCEASLTTLKILADTLGVSPSDLQLPDSDSASTPARAAVPEGLRRWICSFDAFIDNRSRGFVGRQFVLEALDQFVSDRKRSSGYFVLQGVPGIGKSAFLAHLVNSRSLPIHHFNIALQSINTARSFIGNVCARLITYFALPYTTLPVDFDKDGSYLNSILAEAAQRTSDTSPIVIAVDALDEVADSEHHAPANVLFLPPSLPPGVFFVATTRPSHNLRLQAHHAHVMQLDAGSDENLVDAQQYVRSRSRAVSIHDWLRAQSLPYSQFEGTLLSKSEGNFMYLHHVLTSIERNELGDTPIDTLPQGLRAYYQGHWVQMQRTDARFVSVVEPVICVLAAVRQPVSMQEISEFTSIDIAQIRPVLRQWREFLYKTTDADVTRYRLYHGAFQEFLQEDIDPGLKRHHALIADAALTTIAGTRRRKR